VLAVGRGVTGWRGSRAQASARAIEEAPAILEQMRRREMAGVK